MPRRVPSEHLTVLKLEFVILSFRPELTTQFMFIRRPNHVARAIFLRTDCCNLIQYFGSPMSLEIVPSHNTQALWSSRSISSVNANSLKKNVHGKFKA